MSFLKILFSKEPAALPPPAPYEWATRPLPIGDDLEHLLPPRVGAFVRIELRRPSDVHRDPVYAHYRTETWEVFVELGICDDPRAAQSALATAKGETEAEAAPQCYSAGTEPSFLKTISPRLGAFVAWTRGCYFFSAHAKGGDAVLSAFMNSYPY